MGRNKDDGAGKFQAVISRFFLPKQSEQQQQQEAQQDQDPACSSRAVAATVEWPPTGKSSLLNRKRSRQEIQDAELKPKRSKDGGNAGAEVRHKKFVKTLLVQPDRADFPGSNFYGKPPAGNEKYTPLEQQVVELKSKYPDVLLMIEVGYKFRFFGRDAEVAAKLLGIIAHYDRNFLTASIPTFRLHVHVRRLVEAGYKVGVIKQTETAAIKAHGANKGGPFSRDLSALYTKATLEAGEFLGGEDDEAGGRLCSYMMCVVEEPILERKKRADERGNFDARFGVVAVDPATGDIMHGHFMDTVTRSELEVRLLTCAPVELLLTSSLSSVTEKLLLDYAGPSSNVRVERVYQESSEIGGIAAIAEFYGRGFPGSATSKANEGLEVLMTMPDLVVAAFGHLLCHLKQFNLENVLHQTSSIRPFADQQEMALSSNTLRQLEVLSNNVDGTERGSLFWLMNHTHTSMGARLLRYWVSHPLRDRSLISARLDAVAEISEALRTEKIRVEGSGSGKGSVASRGAILRVEYDGLLPSMLSALQKVPDLERGITRIYHKTATTSEFITVVQGIVETANRLERLKENPDSDTGDEFVFRSALLKRLLVAATSSSVTECGRRLLSSLNTAAAIEGDKLNLFVLGQFPEVDKCRENVKLLEQEIEGLLPAYRRLLKMPKLEFMAVSGAIFLLEVNCGVHCSWLDNTQVPSSQRVPSNWIKINSTKKANRYHSPEVIEAIDRLNLAKEELAVACARAWISFLQDFGCHYVDFRAAVQALAAIDCLYSLATLAKSQGYVRPEFVADDEPCCLNIEAGRHPVLDTALRSTFVPNDTRLCEGQERCQIITGPNMGGKSCYIRQVALITIMAQIGSYVPACCAKLHVFDAVHTRMGASDSILRGSSTFFEELSEASSILNKATKRSLVIMDELGRGTSTYDGVAIAYAALHYLLQHIKCFTLFVTHYPKIAELVEDFPGSVGAYHVSYMAALPDSASTSSSDDQHPVPQTVTFLYKLQPGVAKRSFGLQVARLAMIPETCVATAARMATNLENEVRNRVCQSKKLEEVLLRIQGSCSSGTLSTLREAQCEVRDLLSGQESSSLA